MFNFFCCFRLSAVYKYALGTSALLLAIYRRVTRYHTDNDFPLVLLHRRVRFAFLNREDMKDIQNVANAAKYAEKVENSKIPRGAQVRTGKNRTK